MTEIVQLRPGWRKPLVACGVAITLFGFVSSAQAGLFDDDEARKAILDLRARVEAFQRDVNERLNIINGRIDRLEQTSRGQLELSNQIESLRGDIARLRGQLEVQANELSELQRRNRDQLVQLNERLRKFDPVAVNVDGKQIQLDPAEKRAYDAALSFFQNSDFKSAHSALNNFSLQYPQSALRANADYWAATSLFALRDWRGAINALQSFVARFADSVRAPEALLSLAAAHIELKDTANARKTFEQIIERFPDNAAATQAREKLAALPAERPKR
jgi:tol-pal system protein YbgF